MRAKLFLQFFTSHLKMSSFNFDTKYQLEYSWLPVRIERNSLISFTEAKRATIAAWIVGQQRNYGETTFQKLKKKEKN